MLHNETIINYGQAMQYQKNSRRVENYVSDSTKNQLTHTGHGEVIR